MSATSAPGASAVPPGLDLDRLQAYLVGTRPGLLDGPVTAEVIAGGRSNLTYRLRARDQTAVLRRPPLGHVLPTAHDMAREFRVIEALHPTGFPVPQPLHLCANPDVIGAPFYLMSHVEGWVPRDADDVARLSYDMARRCGDLLVDTLVALHATDPVAVGLGDFGRPDGFLDRQVRRWYQQWVRSKTRELATLERLATILGERRPTSTSTGIVHGDYRQDNVMFDHDITAILAVLDWEMATLGDPLADLGLFVVYTELAADGLSPTQPRCSPEQGFASAPQLIDRYARLVPTTPIDRIGWYVAFGYYKLAIISEGIHARYLQGKTVGTGFERLGPAVPLLVDRGHAALAQGA